MAINVHVTRNNNENSASVLRRFVKKVRSAGYLQLVRDNRTYQRKPSKLRRKKSKLVGLDRSATYARDLKLGKTQEK